MKKLFACLLVGLIGGCAAGPFTVHETGQARHVVICWLKPGADASAVIDACKKLSQIPGVMDITAGKNLPSQRSVVESTYDVAVIITFENESAMRAYDQHPIHKEIVESVIKPNVEKYQVFDSRIDFYTWGKSVDDQIEARRAAALKEQSTRSGR